MKGSLPVIRILILVVMAATTFYTGLVVGSKAREVKSQIRVIEDGSEKAVLKAQFRTYHQRSVTLNTVVMVLGLVFTFITATLIIHQGLIIQRNNQGYPYFYLKLTNSICIPKSFSFKILITD